MKEQITKEEQLEVEQSQLEDLLEIINEIESELENARKVVELKRGRIQILTEQLKQQ